MTSTTTQMSLCASDLDHEVADNQQEAIDQPATGRMEQALDAIRNFATMAKVLRFLGACAVVGSLSTFLLQGWDQGNDVNRYFLLLAQTVLLTVVGFALSHLLKENKGARVFFGLSLVSVPANFAILGALILSVVQWDAAIINVPQYASWTLVGATTVFGTFALALAVLVPVSYFGLAIMARRSAGTLLVPFFLLNAALLIPVRVSLFAGPLALAALVVALIVIKRALSNDSTLKTVEGRFACLMLLVPSVLILIRTASLYKPDTMLVMLIAATVYVMVRHVARQFTSKWWLGGLLEVAGLIPAIVFSLSACRLSMDWIPFHYYVPVFIVTISALLLDTAYRSQHLGKWFCRLAAIVLSLGFIANLVLLTHVSTAMMCFFIGIVVSVLGFAIKDRLTSVMGTMAIAAGVIFLGHLAFEHIHLFNWMSLAVFGVIAIIFASLIDLHGARIKLSSAAWARAVSSRFDEPAGAAQDKN